MRRADFHARVDDAENAFGEMFRCWRKIGEDPTQRVIARAIFMETHGATEEVVGMEAAEEEVGVGDGGVVATAVAGGTGIGSGGLRTHLQRAGSVHPCERTAAGAGGVDVEHGHADRETCYLALGAGGWLASSVKQSYVGGSTTHVEGEHAFDACSAGDAERADDSAGRTGEDGADGFAGGDAAERMPPEDCMMLRRAFRLARPRSSVTNVLLHARSEISIERDG